MSATAAVNKPPPAHPGPNGGNSHPHANTDRTPSQQQDPGLHGASQDPGPSYHPQHHVSARPVFYVQAPPPHPHPFLPYQWPMPFSYNPFAGFPGMGYGMVMPPFPPPPYMEAPAYILPHPQLQPVDYRRLLHPQGYAPSAPYQNPNQARRVHLPFTIRETVNSEVQTEPTQRSLGGYGEESPVLSTDSGGGTASNSPSPSSSTSKKQSSAEVENNNLSHNTNDKLVKRTSACSTAKCLVLQPTGLKTAQAHIGEALEKQQSHKVCVGQANDASCLDTRYNGWSVSSAEGMVPVCSSFQQEEVFHERHDSVPDILMSWGGGTTLTMADKLPQNDLGTEVENDQLVYQSPTVKTKGPVVADSVFVNDSNLSSRDSAVLCKILKMREAYENQKAESKSETGSMGLVSVGHCPPYKDELLHSQNSSDEHPDNGLEDHNEANPQQDKTDITPYCMSSNSSQMKRNMNESVWSVESLAPYIPTKEWLLQNVLFEPQVIVEMTDEDDAPLTPHNKTGDERRQTQRLSSSDTVLMSDSWLMFSTPAEKRSPPKKQSKERTIDTSEMRPEQVHNIGPLEKDSFTSTRLLPSKIVSSPAIEEDVDINGSPELEANQSPNQESLINEQQEKNPCSPKQEEKLPFNSVGGGKISSTGQMVLQNKVLMEDEVDENKVSQLRKQQLSVPMADQKMADESHSKGNMVDCAVQCNKLQDCECKDRQSHNCKKAFNVHVEDLNMRGRMQRNQKKNHYRHRGQGKEMHREWVQPLPPSDKQSSQQEAYSGCYVKTQRGNGRNSRY